MGINDSNQEQRKRKNNSTKAVWWIIAIVLGVVLNLADSGINFDAVFAIIQIAIFIIVIAAVIKIRKSAVEKRADRDKAPAAERQGFPKERRPVSPERPQLSKVPNQMSFFREEGRPARSQAVRQKEEYRPIEMSSTEYDRQKRLKQLDGFLKNGIIDREEYKVLRARYEKQ